MLTLQGYRIPKSKFTKAIKDELTVKPYIPTVFVNPRFVQKFTIFKEDTEFAYVPKHYGTEKFGKCLSERNIRKTDPKYWKFAGALREAQRPVVNSFLTPEPRDGIISLKTGGGKTVCGLYIASQLQYPTLILVHNTFLRDQWVDRIKAFLPEARIGIIQGEKFDTDKDVVVGMLQTVSMKEHSPKAFECFGLVIFDECHHIASEAFSQALLKVTSKHMLGLSATPERKDKLMCVMNWGIGPILYESENADSVDKDVQVEVFEFQGDEKYNEIIYNNSGVMFTSLMVNKVAECNERNKLLVEILEDVFADPTRKILVLSDRVIHVQTLFDMLPPHIQKDAGILSRGMKPDVRTKFCDSKKILIATYHLLKEGFDLESLNTLLMATSRPDVVQILGRILRQEKSKRKIHPLILDVIDEPFRRQFQERLSLYKQRKYNVQIMKI